MHDVYYFSGALQNTIYRKNFTNIFNDLVKTEEDIGQDQSRYFMNLHEELVSEKFEIEINAL